MYIKDLETPNIIVDYEKLIKNIEEASILAKTFNKNLRPMMKTHKSVEIAKIQEKYGINGIQCAKLSEAQVFSENGFKDIFVSSEIVDEKKLIYAKKLSKKVEKLILSVDSVEGIRRISDVFNDEKIYIRIEINSGHNRCGIKSEDVLILYRELEKNKNLIFDGVFTHGGHSYYSKDKIQRKEAALKEAEEVLRAKKILNENGIKCDSVSVGSTPSFIFSLKIDGITEVRPGNYVFYDLKQVKLGVIKLDRVSLFVLSQVISKPDDNRAFIDAGAKVLSMDYLSFDNEKIYGYIIDHPDIDITNLSEEHGWLKIKERTKINIGDKLKIIPVHSCLVINNFDHFYLVKGEEVLKKVDIEARGKFE